MQLRIAKKEKPYMRISYSMLYQHKDFKNNDRVKNINSEKIGIITKIDSGVHVTYDDNSDEMLSFRDANKFLSIIHEKTCKPEVVVKKPTTREQRIENILNEAVRKGEIEKNDIEIKKIELETYSDKDLDEYEKKINDSYDENFSQEPKDEKTEAELTLDMLRSSGKVPINFGDIEETSSRSLTNAKLDHEIQMQKDKQFMNDSNFTKDGLTFDFGLEKMKNDFANESRNFTRPKDHMMTNLHGLTTPIVQQPQEGMSIKDMLLSMDWTINGTRK